MASRLAARCFASGATLDELKEALIEAIGMRVDNVEGTASAHVDEMRVLVA